MIGIKMTYLLNYFFKIKITKNTFKCNRKNYKNNRNMRLN